MTEEVMISIAGIHDDTDEDGRTELITIGKYYVKNGRHYLCYVDNSNDDSVTNVIRIADDRMDVMRSGSQKSHMAFKNGEESMTQYPTPAGILPMDIYTTDVTTQITEDKLETTVKYSLSLNNEFINNCTVIVTARSKHEK